jgi:poly(ADP-ribose) glycohydrolase ARH3
MRDCREDEFRWQLRAARRLRDGHTLSFLGNSLPAHRSVVTAIACFTTCPTSFERCVEKAIAQGDDTDTLAAMAGALCGAHLGVSGIPAPWVEALERGPKGLDYLRELADGLWQLHHSLVTDTEIRSTHAP